MKKLMVAVAIACAAVVSQASSFNWGAPGSRGSDYFYDVDGNDLPDQTVYLFAVTEDFNQNTLLSGLRDGGKITDYTNVKTASTDGGILPDTPFTYGEAGNDYEFFMATVLKDKVLISDSAFAAGTESMTEDVFFNDPADWSDGSYGAYYGTANFAEGKAGWYDAAATPEPTSGLLLLIGVAGLALRRKRA